ncbi:MAG: hypothetical protein Q8M22_03310 [Actinomycetota bacterium]|nr:hypothetical protein [Actinomycetota bacterium]
MNEFHDPDLENLLGRTGGPFPDVNVAFQQVQGRVRQVKRRRAAVVSGAACSLLFAAAVFAGTRQPGSDTVRPGDSTGERDSLPGSTDTLSSSPDQSLVPVTDGSTNSSVTPVSTPTVTAPGATTPTGSAPGGSTPSSSTPTSSTPATTPTTTASTTASTSPATTPPAPVTQTFSGVGGSVTVRMQNGTLTLVSSSPATGFAADVRKASGDRVEVRFESAAHRTEIRIDLVGGSMVPDIREQAT